MCSRVSYRSIVACCVFIGAWRGVLCPANAMLIIYMVMYCVKGRQMKRELSTDEEYRRGRVGIKWGASGDRTV